MYPMAAVRMCAVCETSLDGMRSRAIFCGQKCKNRARLDKYRADWLAEMSKTPCRHCGEPLVGRRRDSKWCSERCARSANKLIYAATKRRHNLKAKYGLDEGAYQRMVRMQRGRCAICRGNDPKRPDGKWAVDHDHVTGQVRGLLCSKCNTGIGQLRDDPEIIAAAARYVRKHRQMVLSM